MNDTTENIYHEETKGLDIDQAIKEAKRCLNCKNPQCKAGCPISNDIPEFIYALSRGNIGEARDTIAQKSNLPAVCGRVCPHELQCEGSCVLGKKGKNIKIGQLERFIADFAFQNNIAQEKNMPHNRGKVAVIGSGPAGLTVAGDLAKNGFLVTVYEALPEPGGILLYGIPSFRLPKDVVRREIKQIESLGVNFVTNSTAGVDFNVDTLFDAGFDAVFIGSGTAIAKELDIPGKDLVGIVQSSYFLRMVSLLNSNQVERKELPLKQGDVVLVIGCGNVGIDAARSAVRLGAASVTVIYRGEQETMPALKSEYDLAVADGVKFIWAHTPIEYIGENNKVTGLKLQSGETQKTVDANKIFWRLARVPQTVLSRQQLV